VINSSVELAIILSGLVATGVAVALGHWLGKWMGAGILGVLALTAGVLCRLGYLMLGWPGLVAATLAVAAAGAGVGHALSKRRGAWMVSLMWLGWCAFCWYGFLLAGITGLVFITFPSVGIFWWGAYLLASKVLPLREGAKRSDKMKALRAFLTFTLGKNYPYYTVENRKKTLRVPGNPFGQFFAGPGIVITACDHTVVITDNIKIKAVPEPGFTFTGQFEGVGEVIDLRAQLRAFHVEAITRDGIRIKVLTFVPFRIQAGRWPKPGEPFPFSKKAVFQAVQGQIVERSREQKDGKVVENIQKHTWDGRVEIVATRVVRQIIGEFKFDDLCAPYDPRNPRQEIVEKLKDRLKSELSQAGIELIGGGISNLVPEDPQLLQQRIGNWQAEWQRRIAAEIGRGEAESIRMVESARAQAQAEMIRTISEGFERAGATESVSAEVVALRFVEALEKMIKSPDVQRALPPGPAETVETMRRSFEVQRR